MREEAEKILDKHYQPKMHWKSVNRENVIDAMLEFYEQKADTQSIEFAKWIPFNAVIAQDGYHYLFLKDLQPITEEDLFEKFKAEHYKLK